MPPKDNGWRGAGKAVALSGSRSQISLLCDGAQRPLGCSPPLLGPAVRWNVCTQGFLN